MSMFFSEHHFGVLPEAKTNNPYVRGTNISNETVLECLQIAMCCNLQVVYPVIKDPSKICNHYISSLSLFYYHQQQILRQPSHYLMKTMESPPPVSKIQRRFKCEAKDLQLETTGDIIPMQLGTIFSPELSTYTSTHFFIHTLRRCLNSLCSVATLYHEKVFAPNTVGHMVKTVTPTLIL